MQKKDTVALLHHADKPSEKLVVGKPNTLRLLIPALTPHSQIKEKALPACKRGLAKAELSQGFSTGKLKHHENAISVRRVYERRRRKRIRNRQQTRRPSRKKLNFDKAIGQGAI